MDKDEEAGLRAFALTVGCHAAGSDRGLPAWVERDGVGVDVAEVESQWREEERHGYRLRLADGAHLLVYYVPELDLWSGVAQVLGAGGET